MNRAYKTVPSRHSTPLAAEHRAVIFDGDDTLWMTEALYDDARAACRRAVEAIGIDGATWEDAERRIDVDNVGVFGHSSHRFPRSCRQAYELCCRGSGRRPDTDFASQIEDLASSVFHRVAPVREDARTTIEKLRSCGVLLALLTKGELSVQRKRIADSGLSDLFGIISIVERKGAGEILDVVSRLGAEPQRTWLVGNSLRSDIQPAISAGIHAIWIDAHVWEYERTGKTPPEGAIEARSLAEVVPLVLR